MKTLLKKDCTTKTSVKILLNEQTLLLFKNNSLKTKHALFFKNIIEK